MKNKQVGQVLYILSRSDMNLIPVLVVEEMIKRTLDGENVSYIVEAIGKNGAKKRYTLDESTMKAFDEISDAREFLVNNAVEAINTLCSEAFERSKLFFEASQRMKNNPEKDHEDPVQEYEEVLLEDGTVAKIRVQ